MSVLFSLRLMYRASRLIIGDDSTSQCGVLALADPRSTRAKLDGSKFFESTKKNKNESEFLRRLNLEITSFQFLNSVLQVFQIENCKKSGRTLGEK